MRRTPTKMIGVGVLVIGTIGIITLGARPVGRRAHTVHPSSAVVMVDGLTCDACVRRLEDRIAKLPGVKNAGVDLARQAAGVTFDSGAPISADDIRAAVRDAGFQATGGRLGKNSDSAPRSRATRYTWPTASGVCRWREAPTANSPRSAVGRGRRCKRGDDRCVRP